MAAIRKDLSIVKIYVQNKWYEIRCEKPKVQFKQDNNKRTACNSPHPYEVNPGEVEVTVEFPGVDQGQRSIFSGIMKRQISGKFLHRPTVAIYKYDYNGKVVEDYLLRDFYLESIDQEGNDTVDVKGGAMTPYTY